MRVAISTDGDFVSVHFGRCPQFTLVDIDKNKVTKREIIDNPGHHPGFLPQFLSEKGAACIIAGGMGMRAQELFSQAGIDSILGVEGSIDSVIEQLIAGKLKGGESICSPGAGKGYGVDKSACDHESED
jgi:predicted Fe-Mo cluster-binding NifX family protein